MHPVADHVQGRYLPLDISQPELCLRQPAMVALVKARGMNTSLNCSCMHAIATGCRTRSD